MKKEHWYIIAGLGGLALGFFYLGTSSGYGTNTVLTNIYNAGMAQSTGGSAS